MVAVCFNRGLHCDEPRGLLLFDTAHTAFYSALGART